MTERPFDDEPEETDAPTARPTPDGENDDRGVDRGDRIRIDPDRTGPGGPDRGDEPRVDDEDEYAYPEPSATPVEPGAVDPEHAAFVVLGALAMLAVLFRIAGVAL